ncbi:unnamed protein product [Ectocarpus sp. 4 AP-2014]
MMCSTAPADIRPSETTLCTAKTIAARNYRHPHHHRQSLVLHRLLRPTPEPVQAGPLSLGCFNDDGDDRIMDERALVDTSMTTELCELTCAGSSYFSTQYGREVRLTDASVYSRGHGESTECAYECPGNPDETCGGFDAASV